LPIITDLALPSKTVADEVVFGEAIVDRKTTGSLHFNYTDTSINAIDLRALGLAIMLTSTCGGACGASIPLHQRRDWHFRFPWNLNQIEMDPSFRSCACPLPKSLGFDPLCSTQYVTAAEFWIFNQPEEELVFCRIVTDLETGELHFFSLGIISSLLGLQSYAWNAETLDSISHKLRQRIASLAEILASSDLQCLLLSYRPLPGVTDQEIHSVFKDPVINMDDARFGKYCHNQIILGILICGHVPKPVRHIQYLILGHPGFHRRPGERRYSVRLFFAPV